MKNMKRVFYMPPFFEELKIIESLNQVHSHIWNNYPDIEIKKTEEFIFFRNQFGRKVF